MRERSIAEGRLSEIERFFDGLCPALEPGRDGKKSGKQRRHAEDEESFLRGSRSALVVSASDLWHE